MLNNDIAKELLDSALFIDVTNKQLIPPQSQTKTEVVSVDNAKNFIKSSEDYWASKGSQYTNFYQSGSFIGKGDHSNIQLSEFLKKFTKLLEQIIRNELSKKNMTAEGFSNDFKTILLLFNMIQDHLKLLNCEIKNEEFVAMLHGFVNSYVNGIK